MAIPVTRSKIARSASAALSRSAAIACAGLAYLALDGVGGDGWLGLRWIPLLLPFVGAGLAGFGPA